MKKGGKVGKNIDLMKGTTERTKFFKREDRWLVAGITDVHGGAHRRKLIDSNCSILIPTLEVGTSQEGNFKICE